MGRVEHDEGIIPAYAGSTCSGHAVAAGAWDHPRIRGEHAVPKVQSRCPAGSSPHTRGALRHFLRHSPSWWIIPAYAGSTILAGRHRAPIRDHPRIRGEHRRFYGILCRIQGSSPHTRGAPCGRARDRCGRGIIPAYAGSTRSRFLD